MLAYFGAQWIGWQAAGLALQARVNGDWGAVQDKGIDLGLAATAAKVMLDRYSDCVKNAMSGT